MNQKHLYIPIETKNREFDAKVLLSCAAAEAGYAVVLGYKKRVLRYLETAQPGIFLDKSMPYRKIAQYIHYKKLGHRLVGHDEEGLAPFNTEEYQQRREFCDATIEHFDAMLTWGQWQADFIRSKISAPYHEKIMPCGHPRADLTRRELRGFYQDAADRIAAQYGRFILINTNFSFGNHFFGEGGFVKMLAETGKISDEAHREFYVALQRHQEQLWKAFIAAIAALHERFPAMTIIVRPHPSENHARWKEVLPQHENIQVVHEGTIIPWLLAAAVTIHNSCTTGVEAYLLERPVIAYLPVRNARFEGYVANELAEPAEKQADLVNAVRRYVEDGQPAAQDADKQRVANHHITSLDGALSCDRIVTILNTIACGETSGAQKAYRLFQTAKRACRQFPLLGRRRGGASLDSAADDAPEDAAKAHKQQKFPGVALDEVQAAMRQFQRLLGRFARVQAGQLDKDLFRIE